MTRFVAVEELFKGRHFHREIVVPNVRRYCSFKLSYRDSVAMMGERGIDLAHTTILRWVQHYTPEFQERWSRFARPVGGSWRMDETYVRVKGEWTYLYRAVDKRGQTVDFYLSKKPHFKMMETDNLDVVAVSDVFDKRVEQAATLPEYWHFHMATDAVAAGKHVYLEKPMTHTVEQSRKLVAKVFEFAHGLAEIPDTLNILLDYPEGLTVQLISSMANDTRLEHLLRGHKATLRFTPSGFTIQPQAIFGADAQEITHQKAGAEELDLHHRNLMNAIRANEPLKCDADLGYYGVGRARWGRSAIARANIKWDHARERVVAA